MRKKGKLEDLCNLLEEVHTEMKVLTFREKLLVKQIAKETIEIGAEVWKHIPGFDKYEMSNLGRVRWTGKTRVHQVKIRSDKGVKRVVLSKNGKFFSRSISKLKSEIFGQNNENL